MTNWSQYEKLRTLEVKEKSFNHPEGSLKNLKKVGLIVG